LGALSAAVDVWAGLFLGFGVDAVRVGLFLGVGAGDLYAPAAFRLAISGFFDWRGIGFLAT
jgi:hypothetical protein